MSEREIMQISAFPPCPSRPHICKMKAKGRVTQGIMMKGGIPAKVINLMGSVGKNNFLPNKHMDIREWGSQRAGYQTDLSQNLRT